MRKSRFQQLREAFRGLDGLTRGLMISFVVAGLITSALAFNLVRNLVVSTTAFELPGLAIDQGSDSDQTEDTGTGSAESIGPELEVWDGTSRVNILVMGLDARDWESGQGAPRTDTMVVATIDPATHTAGLLSLPRDLWVEVPGYGHQKINTAYQLGEGSRLPGGGPGLAVDTVEQFLGITIHYYAQIDFFAFEQFIDEIGGVKIEVERNIRLQLIGEDETVFLDNGRYTLNGAYALAYARQRKEDDPSTPGDGDFDRARRQQQIILGLRDQLLRPDVQAIILSDGLRIYQDLSSGVNTNMSFTQMLQLGLLAAQINLEDIQRAVIAPPDQVTVDTSPEGLSILKPISEQIRILRDQVFSSGSVRSALANNSGSDQRMQLEAANVMVFNGSGIEGLADRTRIFLEGLGMSISNVGSADPVNGTTIYDYTGNPYTLAFLVDTMGVSKTNIFSRYDPNSQVDLEVILGPEWVVPSN